MASLMLFIVVSILSSSLAVHASMYGYNAVVQGDLTVNGQAVRPMVNGSGITLTDDGSAITVSNSDGGSAVTLTSAGGTYSLVNNSSGPTLATKGLSAGTGISITATASDATISVVLASICQQLWPIGSVYISVSATDPASLLGCGTWAALAPGRVLVSVDATQPEFDTLREIGGAKTHTLTSNEIPAHNHTIAITDPGHTHNWLAKNSNDGNANAARQGNSVSSATSIATSSATTGITASAANTGGGQAHNNLQPYYVVSMWERTA